MKLRNLMCFTKRMKVEVHNDEHNLPPNLIRKNRRNKMNEMKRQNTEKATDKGDKVKAVVSPRLTFLQELQDLINRHNKENDSNTPDFILAQYLNNCLTNFNLAQQQRSDWYSG